MLAYNHASFLVHLVAHCQFIVLRTVSSWCCTLNTPLFYLSCLIKWERSLLAVFHDSAVWQCYIGYQMRIMCDFYSWWRIWKTLKYCPPITVHHDCLRSLSPMTLHSVTHVPPAIARISAVWLNPSTSHHWVLSWSCVSLHFLSLFLLICANQSGDRSE